MAKCRINSARVQSASGPRFAEFFAGIGLMRLGLERAGWSCAFANDIDVLKAQMYEDNFGRDDIHVKDVWDVEPHEVTGTGAIDLVTASFPCTDLSLAGRRAGIRHGQSAAFWGFADVLRRLKPRPRLVLLENVLGLLRSNGGRDFRDVARTLNALGYSLDLFVVDARWFVPQSRPRLFIVGAREESRAVRPVCDVLNAGPTLTRPAAVLDAIGLNRGLHWSLAELELPPIRSHSLRALLEPIRTGSSVWWTRRRADYLLNQFRSHHATWIHDHLYDPHRYHYGTVFRRMRNGRSTAELRTDGCAGCLRTPKGGSARQILVRVGKGRFDVRYLTPRECARLMGAEDFVIRVGDTQALFGFGDAVCVPAITWLARTRLASATRHTDVGSEAIGVA